jgi:hypothetical protein
MLLTVTLKDGEKLGLPLAKVRHYTLFLSVTFWMQKLTIPHVGRAVISPADAMISL